MTKNLNTNNDNSLFNLPYGAPLRETLDFDLENEPSLTVQSEMEACDIDHIVKQYTQTGIWPVNSRQPGSGQFADVSEIGDYREALNVVREAEKAFMALPAMTRAEFQNDPGSFLEFAQNPQNIDRMVELGLAVPAPVEAPSSAPHNAGAEGAPSTPETPLETA